MGGCDENKMGLCLMWHRQWLYSRWSTHTSCTQRFHLTCQIRVNYQGIESVWQRQLLKMHSRAYNAASKWIYSWKGQNSLKTFDNLLNNMLSGSFFTLNAFFLFSLGCRFRNIASHQHLYVVMIHQQKYAFYLLVVWIVMQLCIMYM